MTKRGSPSDLIVGRSFICDVEVWVHRATIALPDSECCQECRFLLLDRPQTIRKVLERFPFHAEVDGANQFPNPVLDAHAMDEGTSQRQESDSYPALRL